jgi:hypothetical protein
MLRFGVCFPWIPRCWVWSLLVAGCTPSQHVAPNVNVRDSSKVCSDSLVGEAWVSVFDSALGTPLKFASVMAGPSAPRCSAVAGAAGVVHLMGLPIGPNKLRVNYVGYQRVDTAIEVASGIAADVAIRLPEWDGLRDRCPRGSCPELSPRPLTPGINLHEEDRLRASAVRTALYLGNDPSRPIRRPICVSISSTKKRDPQSALMIHLKASHPDLWPISQCVEGDEGRLVIRSTGQPAARLSVDLKGQERDGRHVVTILGAEWHCVYAQSAEGWHAVRCPVVIES